MKYKERKRIEQHKQEIITALPSFLNQLLLLLNSGMVLQEAMITIAKNYTKSSNGAINSFSQQYIKVYLDSQKTGKSILSSFDEYCKNSQIKELTRLSGILIDGDNRGINLNLKLAEESEKLWRQRKTIALEKIRLVDSKMSFPLGLLLIALIIIAAAPAMMQMYI